MDDARVGLPEQGSKPLVGDLVLPEMLRGPESDVAWRRRSCFCRRIAPSCRWHGIAGWSWP